MYTEDNTFFKVTMFRLWFPIIPFLFFWIASFATYHVGPIIYPSLHFSTYIYLLSSFFLFIIGYRVGLRRINKNKSVSYAQVNRNNIFIVSKLRYFSFFGFIGTLGFVVDKLITGAGSIDRTLNHTGEIRTDIIAITPLTTFSVLPYSFLLIALAVYFYALGMKWKVSKYTHFFIFGSMFLLAFNSFLSVNRGSFFWILTYAAFYIFFIKSESVKGLLWKRQYKKIRKILLIFLTISLMYFAFIAKNRNLDDGLYYLTQSYIPVDRYDLLENSDDPDKLASYFLLSSYASGGFRYIDSFLQLSEPLYFNPIWLIGGRTLDQYRRIAPDFVSGAVELNLEWRAQSGLSYFGWPTIFGWNIAMFGYFGAVIFTYFLGFTFGRVVSNFIYRFDVGSLIIIFGLYGAFNMSFNWIGGDLTHNLCYLYGLFLILAPRKTLRLNNKFL